MRLEVGQDRGETSCLMNVQCVRIPIPAHPRVLTAQVIPASRRGCGQRAIVLTS